MIGSDQYRFGEDEQLQQPYEEEGTDVEYNGFGEELGKASTKAGFNRYDIASLYQKYVIKSGEERAAFAAKELVRSGHVKWFCDRTIPIVIEELLSEDQTLLLVEKLRELAFELKYDPDSWEATVIGIRAAIARARAPKSREHVNSEAYFGAIVSERAQAHEEDREPDFDFPEIPEHMVHDVHTYRVRPRVERFDTSSFMQGGSATRRRSVVSGTSRLSDTPTKPGRGAAIFGPDRGGDRSRALHGG